MAEIFFRPNVIFSSSSPNFWDSIETEALYDIQLLSTTLLNFRVAGCLAKVCSWACRKEIQYEDGHFLSGVHSAENLGFPMGNAIRKR